MKTLTIAVATLVLSLFALGSVAHGQTATPSPTTTLTPTTTVTTTVTPTPTGTTTKTTVPSGAPSTGHGAY